MTPETVICREKLSLRKKGVLWVFWLAIFLLLVALTIIELISKETIIVSSILLGVGIIVGVRIGRDKEWFSENNPRETI